MRCCIFIAFFFMFFCSAPGSDGSEWHVSESPLRYELRLTEHPTHPNAGYFLSLPDGGLLPGPMPVSHAVAADGKPAPSYLLWHNPASFAGIVFADPGIRDEVVFIYFTGEKEYRTWNPDTGLTPGAILVSEPGKSKMEDARALGKFGRVGQSVRFWNHIGPRVGRFDTAFSIGGDLEGRSRPGVFYLLAHVLSYDPGKTWLAPFTLHGETEVRFEGKPIVPRKRIDKWGGTGQWIDVCYDPRRMEVFQTAPGTGEYFSRRTGGLMYLAWRTPNATMKELGGVRPEDAPMAGTSAWEARVLAPNEVVRSGNAVVDAVRSRDGGPVAFINAAPTHVFWVDKEMPLILYELSAMSSANPDDTVYNWRFEDGAQAAGETIRWLFPGLKENRIALSASSGGTESKTRLPIHAFAHVSTSFNEPEHRAAYRAAIHQMLRAYDEMPEKPANWNVAYWNNLLRSLEFGGGYAILLDLFTKHADALRLRLADDQIAALQEMLLDAVSGVDPSAALEWAEKFHDEARYEERKKHLVIRRAAIHAHYLDEFEEARRLLSPLSFTQDAIGQLARVRLGDIAFMERDLNLATRHYANVQKLARHEHGMFSGVYDALSRSAADKPVEKRVGPASVADTLKGDRERLMEEARRQRQRTMDFVRVGPGGTPDRPSALWKLGALLDVSASENVRHLIETGYLLEARQALDAWERALPLSKISGDYILLESLLYREVGDPKRAYGMLRAYCDQVDASSYLPEAAKLVLECMLDLEIPEEEIRAYSGKLRDRLEFHPIAGDLERIAKGEKVGVTRHERERSDLHLLIDSLLLP